MEENATLDHPIEITTDRPFFFFFTLNENVNHVYTINGMHLREKNSISSSEQSPNTKKYGKRNVYERELGSIILRILQ